MLNYKPVELKIRENIFLFIFWNVKPDHTVFLCRELSGKSEELAHRSSRVRQIYLTGL